MIEFRSTAVVAPGPEGDTTVLHPISLTLTERRISIIGANGSGKSTLARLINGLVEPSAGTVRITPDRSDHPGAAPSIGRGHHAAGSAERGTAEAGPAAPLDTARDGAAVRRAVGFVFTDPAAQLIMPTVAEDIALSLRRRIRNKADRRAAALTALERFGLRELADRSVHTLSGGQKQLLAIATVLATDPTILVADEPTTLLDLRNSLRIGDLLFTLPQQLVIVTHDLELAARADRTLVVADGAVVFDGAPAEAIAHYRASVAEEPDTRAGTAPAADIHRAAAPNPDLPSAPEITP
ncbi:biotin transport system ATP-binding protein [Leucobacter luti]|uniref:energy-coupling factor ABC transporter ATP-binding protein n=1 Tax=Leucobacter luti TaxID=340320 RepID=UPI001048D9B6|nr:ABC transporter ATP-binding protein [Leucobacter luti]MCW2289426.1 biotin transport system ATP-binding protein [Leucobacter luti]TCK39985.1 biotin transport system ATP-binding protein [Leucobacter luti]